MLLNEGAWGQGETWEARFAYFFHHERDASQMHPGERSPEESTSVCASKRSPPTRVLWL